MTVAVDDLFVVNVEFENGPERAMNVIGYKCSAVLDSDEDVFIQALVDKVVVEAQEYVLNLSGEGTLLVCATARRVPPGEPTRIYTEFGPGSASINPIHPSGAQTAILLSKYAASGETPKQGRIYLPFPAKDLSEDGQIKDGEKTLIASETDPWLKDPMVLTSVGTVLPAIIRLVTGLPAVAALVDDLIIRPVLASQRRRVKHHQNFLP